MNYLFRGGSFNTGLVGDKCGGNFCAEKSVAVIADDRINFFAFDQQAQVFVFAEDSADDARQKPRKMKRYISTRGKGDAVIGELNTV